MPNGKEQALLWAYCASEAQTLAEGLAVLADQGSAARCHALEARRNSEMWSWHWSVHIHGQDADVLDPAGRMKALRQWLTERIAELEQLRERLLLSVS